MNSFNNKSEREQMNVVIVGHVDHGKSTLIGRLLADTGSLPDGKLEQVKATCKRNAKPFEYAFLLDALKDEQSQGITIDTARCFFKSKKRDYIIIDAPGHIEFLKNMITGAARAEAAVLVIDAHEGIKENSKRHGYMMSFLGIKNITIAVNKMDIVGYEEKVFEKIKKGYLEFLNEINLKPMHFIPISAREGDNMAQQSLRMPWYKGASILEALDAFDKFVPNYARALRFPIQDIYKFTQEGDDRRIVAGRIESGTIHTGDEILFLPSQKKSRVKSIENFNSASLNLAFAGQSAGIMLETQIYIRPGEIVCNISEKQPHVSTKIKANIFWMGKQPFIKGRTYKLKIATQKVPVVLSQIISVLDASELSSISNKEQVDRHDVAECILETLKPIAFDDVVHIPETGRFVIVDNYEISGGGIILAPVFETGSSSLNSYIRERDYNWVRSHITQGQRIQRHKHKPALLVITGESHVKTVTIAKQVEEVLFKEEKSVYFLGVSNNVLISEDHSNDKTFEKMFHIRQLGELAHILTDSGQILITSVSEVDEYDLNMLKSLNRPNKTLVVSFGKIQLSEKHIDLLLADDEPLQTSCQKISDFVKAATLLDPEFSI